MNIYSICLTVIGEADSIEFTATGKQIDDYNPKETSAHYTVSFIGEERPYTLLLAKNTDKESQAVEALHKALPALTIVIVAISVLAAVFYAWYMTAPIKKISKMSKQMANMDFGSLCPVERTDEIGVLSDSLNTLSSNLSAALTELKDANQKLQADIDKERELELQRIKFFSAASHELKTPLTAISGYAELMENGMVPPEEIGTFCQKIEKSARRLLSLINDIIRLSELDSANTQLIVEKFDLFEEAALCVENMQIYAEKNDVTITYEGGPQEITANREMINELINNLCANAIRYNKKNGTVKVRVDSEQGHSYLRVEDTGIGIPKEHQKRIFERFYRVDKSRSKQTGGTGLGLAIVKHIVALHDAKLDLQSEVGKGTTITVTF